ncbi:MAG TPA: hypothetical protein VNH13_06015 [Candidatus Acidoferrales bacterium]|nr:hypothetical protein [Candidatus Acidoferrales bacterium]
MNTAIRRAWPIAAMVMRRSALLAVTLALILIVLPAALAAAGPQVSIRG